ncbi:uncharacterized protein LOC119352702 [Triticum dicoccoides]|uniref:uncharacterized protein LOC119352702 n=1 Tax=Triticum dicoccoides TaxID=85692 RepID=UPI001890A167|nr:uncharacterized protein LOC119352702 [Triticum dicoccoides]
MPVRHPRPSSSLAASRDPLRLARPASGASKPGPKLWQLLPCLCSPLFELRDDSLVRCGLPSEVVVVAGGKARAIADSTAYVGAPKPDPKLWQLLHVAVPRRTASRAAPCRRSPPNSIACGGGQLVPQDTAQARANSLEVWSSMQAQRERSRHGFLSRGRHGAEREARSGLPPRHRRSPSPSQKSPRTDPGPASSVRCLSASNASPPGRRIVRAWEHGGEGDLRLNGGSWCCAHRCRPAGVAAPDRASPGSVASWRLG